MEPILPAPAPRTEAELLVWVRLVRSRRVGAQTFLRLMREHACAEAALATLPRIAADAGVRSYQACPADLAAQELAAGRRAGARPVPLGAEEYPPLLATIPDPPPLLWMRGQPVPKDRPMVSLVGARNASALGVRMASHLARQLGEAGFITVSGLARGIDTAAHKASVKTGTCAVLAGGIDRIYPSENIALAEQILEKGTVMSEMPPGLQAQARHFPRRNRIVSGLAPGLVVIEGAAKSGSLITARAAADQGREIMAVPGHPFDARAAGCNMLLRDGATLIRTAEDIAEALALPMPPRAVKQVVPAPIQPKARPTGELRHMLMNMLGPAPIAEDALIRQSQHPAPEVLAALASLDIEGQIQRHPGGLVSLGGP